MKFIISGGGTGGHIFPALSIANALKRRIPDCEILYVGAEGRMEMERVPAAGYKIVGLPVAGFDRKKLWRNIPVLFKALKSLRLARKTVKNFRPDCVIGVGGYASGPTLKAAQKLGIPTLIQEQNSYAGVTNKLLAKKAKAICCAYEGMERFFPAENIILTGNPVRADLAACPLSQVKAKVELGYDPRKPLVLVVGGSLGARTINEAMVKALPEITADGAQVMWQTGKLYASEFTPEAEKYEGVKASAFITDMAVAYKAADIVVARAGAGTISELQLLGKAAILVPSPNVAEDHQRKNAEALVKKSAAIMILDADAREKLGSEVVKLLDDEALRERLAANAAKMALSDADEKIVDKILSLIPNA
ncbi:MAG: undecaprenyldiphospho-muramoylpentapeptide beta-N-acetylglucosaminyltransferase [Bacteroides sp.]|nr:undecaprenyldiphospho-muramoylpentapeptide beta-N-acetylglucosaminyltransferase [Bacteroides sp.]MCM1379213.1 undecaprenyldiphospho-muramoylpentapeptide beta-N-acetylglucosaminyltransferase [Bacteroides sp.]MCM1445138.1 undecaprenyldiphospho-muramoylpentapeptide beta-N-acetylglucosaminyltransferase [Prevotella sp.]